MNRSLLAGTLVGAFAFLGASALAMNGCSYDWTYVDPSTRDAADGGADSTSQEDGGPNPVPPSPPPPEVQCKSAGDCSPKTPGTQFCFFKDGLCGPERTPSAGPGICMDVAELCGATKPEPGLCGCDGMVAKDRCEAAMRGADISQDNSACVKPGATFPCPGITSGCKTGVEYCLVKSSSPNLGSCVSHTSCTSPSVTCSKCKLDVAPTSPPCTCKDDALEAVRLNCP